jgi:hypothetical protein
MLYGYLFYSIKYDDNGFCKSMISLLERHGLNKIIEYKSVDNMSEEQLIKLQIETVPTLFIISDNGQQKNQSVFVGNDAFKWVDNFLLSRRQAIMKNAENSRKLIQNSNTKEKLTQKLYEYCPSEHSGISDAYAYYNEDENKDINMAQGKMFSFGLNNQNENLGTIPIQGKIKDYKLKEGLLATYGSDSNIKKTIEQIENDRKNQEKQFQNNMEQDTIKIVANKIANGN